MIFRIVAPGSPTRFVVEGVGKLSGDQFSSRFRGSEDAVDLDVAPDGSFESLLHLPPALVVAEHRVRRLGAENGQIVLRGIDKLRNLWDVLRKCVQILRREGLTDIPELQGLRCHRIANVGQVLGLLDVASLDLGQALELRVRHFALSKREQRLGEREGERHHRNDTEDERS